MPIFLLWFSLFSTGFAATPPETFTHGLESFKKNDFTQSRADFNELLKQHPNDPTLLYNLGLVELSDKHPGRALAYWRKALYVDPGFSPSLTGISRLAESKALPQLSIPPLLWMYWRVSFTISLALTLGTFLLAGLFWVRYLARKKFSGTSSLWKPLLLSALFVTFAIFSVHNFWLLHKDTKATVMDNNVAVYSSPSLEAPSLFEFNEGDEVVVRRQNGDWFQVQKSATSVGWIRKEQAYIHSGT